MKISILRTNECSDLRSRLDYAVKETRHFLEQYTTAIVSETEVQSCGTNKADAIVSLFIDETMEAHHYALQGDGQSLKISGGNASSVLCGLFEALAEAGILFEATGYSVCNRFDLHTFLSVNSYSNAS